MPIHFTLEKTSLCHSIPEISSTFVSIKALLVKLHRKKG